MKLFDFVAMAIVATVCALVAGAGLASAVLGHFVITF